MKVTKFAINKLINYCICTGSVVLYRIGNHIDISRGPMMSGTHHLGRVSITSVHQIQDEIDGCTLYRVQGVALPKDFVINHFAYNILEKRSENLVILN